MITLGFEDPFLEPQKAYILQGQLAPSAGRQGGLEAWKITRHFNEASKQQEKMKGMIMSGKVR